MIRTLLSKLKPMKFEDATAQMLLRLRPNCDACGLQLSPQHKYVLVACTVATKENPRTLQMSEAFRAHDFNSLTTFQEFEGAENAAIVYAIACPGGGGMLWFVRDPAEFFDSDELLGLEILNAEEMLELERSVTGKTWKLISPRHDS